MPKPSKHVEPILDLLCDGEVTSVEVAAEVGIRTNLALYLLRRLERRGLAREVRRIKDGSRNTVVFDAARTRKTS